MPDRVTQLASQELARLVSRLRSIGAPRLATSSVPPFGTRADAIRHLVHELVTVTDASHGYPRQFEDVLLGDQLAVVGADALVAVATGEAAVDAAFVLGEIVLHRFDLDGSLPRGEPLAVLGAQGVDLVAVLRSRCPG